MRQPGMVAGAHSIFIVLHTCTRSMYYDVHDDMTLKRKTRRVTANLPADLLAEACQVSGAGVTETLTQGLSLVKRGAALTKASRLRGRLKLDINLQVSRERPRR